MYVSGMLNYILLDLSHPCLYGLLDIAVGLFSASLTKMEITCYGLNCILSELIAEALTSNVTVSGDQIFKVK